MEGFIKQQAMRLVRSTSRVMPQPSEADEKILNDRIEAMTEILVLVYEDLATFPSDMILKVIENVTHSTLGKSE